MLKWTVSRSLSTVSSTPHGPDKAARRPFRDLSNTPPATSSSSRTTPSFRVAGNNNVGLSDAPMSNGTSTAKRTPSRRRRCRSHGSDLRGYFQTTKPSARSNKRQSGSPLIESFYQSTPRVDADIGPLTLVSHRQPGQTLPTDPQALLLIGSTELPQSLVKEACTDKLQSHVSDFFHQISLATSPEDVMECEPLPLGGVNHRYNRIATACLPKLAKFAKLQAIRKTPHHVKAKSMENERETVIRQTPLAGKLLSLKLDQDQDNDMRENMETNTLEVLNREKNERERSCVTRSVADILREDSEERRKVLESEIQVSAHSPVANVGAGANNKRADKRMATSPLNLSDGDEEKAAHNDSSVSSASQLLENPSPVSWAFCSPPSDLDAEFTLKRQRAIRRKRQAANGDPNGPANGSKRFKRDKLPFVEAINRHVKRLALETDLDSSAIDDKFNSETKQIEEPANNIQDVPVLDDTLKKDVTNEIQMNVSDPMVCEPQPEEEQSVLDSLASRRPKELTLSNGTWETDSPKSSLLDSFATTTSTACTPEAPLVATVRRCLKYSPETPGVEFSRSGNLGPINRGSIEIECSAQDDCIHVKIIRCKDLRRTYEGPVHAYVKASLKDPQSGEGCVKRTAVHRATSNPVFLETLVLPCLSVSNTNCAARQVSLDIAVWHRDRRARRSELLGCMTLPLPLSQDKEASWHPLEAGSGRNTSGAQELVGSSRGSVASPPLSKDGGEAPDNNNSAGGDELAYLRHLELEPIDPVTGVPLHPGFTARGGRTPCTITRRLARSATNANQVPWGFSLSWGRPPRVERVDPGSPAERSGLRPGDYIVFVDTTNVVTQPRDDILELIQAATNQLILEVYRRGGHGQSLVTPGAVTSTLRRPNSINSTLQSSQHHTITFTAEAFPNLAADALPEEELSVRETRYWACLKSGQTRFSAPLAQRKDVLSATDHMILFQNLEELMKLSEEVRDEGSVPESYLSRVPRITAAYRRYLSGLQRACCLLIALRKNTAFAKIVCEPTVPRKRRPDLTGLLLKPLEHYREMTRLLCQACPRSCSAVRDLAQGYREATANAALMEPPRDNGRPLLSLQEVETRLVFARCKPFALAVPGRQWLFGGALAKVESRGRVQAIWALLLSDLLVFARISRDRVLFLTEEPLRLSCIAEACFTVRKRPTEFRLQITTQPSSQLDNPAGSMTEIVQCTGTVGGGGGGGGGCSPHSRLRRRVLILRAPSPELKAVWHNLLQRQIIYVNTGSGRAAPGFESSDDESPTDVFNEVGNHNKQPELINSSEHYRSSSYQIEPSKQASHDSLDLMLERTNQQKDNHLVQWVRNSHQIPPPDQENLIEEWTPEELAARTPKESGARDLSEMIEENVIVSSDVEQHSTTSSASLSTVKSNSLNYKKNGSIPSSKDNSSGSINICKKCYSDVYRRSGCSKSPPLARDPFAPLPPKISVVPPTPDVCPKHRVRTNINDSPNRCFSGDGNTEDGSEDELDCDADPPYRALRRFGTMSSLDQDDEINEVTMGDEEVGQEFESPLASGLRAWTLRASNYVVKKMSLLEHFSEGCLLQPPAPPERTESSLDPSNNADEEGTTSGGTSGDDIWGTPTSGGPDDESFAGSPPPSNHDTMNNPNNQNLGSTVDDEPEQLDSEGEDSTGLPELNMEQLLGGSISISSSVNTGPLRSYLSRRRLEPLLEEEDSASVGSGTNETHQQVGWW